MCFSGDFPAVNFLKKIDRAGFFHNPMERNAIAWKFRRRFISKRTRSPMEIFHAINRTDYRDRLKIFQKKNPVFKIFFKNERSGSLELFLKLLELLLGGFAARSRLLRELLCLDLLHLVQLRHLFLTRWHTITLAFFLLKNITVSALVVDYPGL
jgi:hypothetical protein